jgi:hypothetical protein
VLLLLSGHYAGPGITPFSSVTHSGHMWLRM